MKDFENAHNNRESSDWDAIGMPGLMPPEFAPTADGNHILSRRKGILGSDKNSSTWDVTTNANIRPNDKNTEFDFEIEDGKPLRIDASKGLELGTRSGKVGIASSSVLKPNMNSGTTHDSLSRVDFRYDKDAEGNYKLALDGAATSTIGINGPWSMHSSVTKAGPYRIRRELSLHKAPSKETDNHSETTTEKSTTKYGGDVSASGGGSQESSLHVELDGNDVVLLLGGAEMKVAKEIAFESEELESALGGFEELLAKQKVTVELESQMAGKLAGSFGYHYEKNWEETATRSTVLEYEDGGVMASEVHEIVVNQDRATASSAGFEEEGQKKASGTTQEQISTYLDKNSHMVGEVKQGLYKIKLTGYASSSGSKDANDQLSLERAIEIKGLICAYDRGILGREHFVTEGRGEEGATQGVIDGADRSVKIEFVKANH